MRWTTGEATRNIAWAVMVFGSSRGGGKAVLGTTGGAFAGRVTLDGGSVYLADGRLPIDESQIPAEGRVAWFDPSADGALEMSSHTQRPLAVRVVHGRGNDGLDKAADYFHLRGTYSSGYDRRPWLCEGSRGGAATKWIDFSDRYPGVVLNGSADNKGNTLRIFKNPAPSTESASTNPNKVNIRSAFVALDSSNGGGMPLIDTVGASEQIKSRMPTRDYNTPIWTNTTAAAVKNGVTRLDGVTVNGTTRGYTGHPEVLSLATTGNVPISYFGWYGGDDAEYPNAEILGEILLFDTILPADVRADVEAYLMRKWTGRVPAGYVDLRGATVAGSGTVRAAGLSALPRFDPSFTGTLELVGDEFAFTLDTRNDPTVAEAVTMPCAVALPDDCTVTVHCAAKPKPGLYRFASAAGIGGGANVSLNVTGETGEAKLRLVVAEGAVFVEVPANGTAILVR